MNLLKNIFNIRNLKLEQKYAFYLFNQLYERKNIHIIMTIFKDLKTDRITFR